MPETLHRDRCATCGAPVVYVTTASQGLWQHTEPLAVHHPPEPLKHLTGGRLADELREAQRVLHHVTVAGPLATAEEFAAAVARRDMFEAERQKRAAAETD